MNKKHILIVEDETYIAEVLVAYCENSGFQATHLLNGIEAVKTASEGKVDLILLDLMLPDMDGIEVFKQVRQFSQLPIIIITAKDEEIDRLLGLELGADDYICKPFSPREVIARVKNILRRSTVSTKLDNEIKESGFILKPDDYEATFKGYFIDLTPKEFKLLEMLLSAPGRVFSREEILNKIYPQHSELNDRNIDTHVKNIRRKINALSQINNPIRSIYGIGYKFEKLH